jgi:hypothetical protein
MQAAKSSETSANFYLGTQRHIPEETNVLTSKQFVFLSCSYFVSIKQKCPFLVPACGYLLRQYHNTLRKEETEK